MGSFLFFKSKIPFLGFKKLLMVLSSEEWNLVYFWLNFLQVNTISALSVSAISLLCDNACLTNWLSTVADFMLPWIANAQYLNYFSIYKTSFLSYYISFSNFYFYSNLSFKSFCSFCNQFSIYILSQFFFFNFL